MLGEHCFWQFRVLLFNMSYLFSGLELHAHIGSCEKSQPRFEDEPRWTWVAIRIWWGADVLESERSPTRNRKKNQLAPISRKRN